jgi:hypothetical protein
MMNQEENFVLCSSKYGICIYCFNLVYLQLGMRKSSGAQSRFGLMHNTITPFRVEDVLSKLVNMCSLHDICEINAHRADHVCLSVCRHDSS